MAGAPAEIIPFSTLSELTRLFSYTIPALALLWYLILEKKSLPLSLNELGLKKEDAVSLAWGFPGLVLAGVLITFTMKTVYQETPIGVEAPDSAAGWAMMIISCISTGYLEESFFRFYLLKKLEDWVPFRPARVIFAVLLFALCHGYEGPWGILNAVIAGILLSVLFERYRSLHGIAWAHGLYNAFVYALSSL